MEQGVELEGDPYGLDEILLEGLVWRAQRAYLKTLVLTAINAKSAKAAFQAFRDSHPTGDRARKFQNSDLERLLQAFISQAPQLEAALFADQGIRLMNVDARIAEDVLWSAAVRDLPVLCVHDSFIVDYRRTKFLKFLMAKSSKRIVGRVLPIASDWMGWDEVPEEKREDFVDIRRIEPTRGS